MHLAAMTGLGEMCRLFMEIGNDDNNHVALSLSCKNEEPLDIAVERGFLALAEKLSVTKDLKCNESNYNGDIEENSDLSLSLNIDNRNDVLGTASDSEHDELCSEDFEVIRDSSLDCEDYISMTAENIEDETGELAREESTCKGTLEIMNIQRT